MKFSKKEAKTLQRIIRWRRDVRGNNFLPKKVKQKDLNMILNAALHAPSVGYSQPWRFLIIDKDSTKNKIHTLLQNSLKKPI